MRNSLMESVSDEATTRSLVAQRYLSYCRPRGAAAHSRPEATTAALNRQSDFIATLAGALWGIRSQTHRASPSCGTTLVDRS
jgi:hypothetical protein